jgi:hypothetical protein
MSYSKVERQNGMCINRYCMILTANFFYNTNTFMKQHRAPSKKLWNESKGNQALKGKYCGHKASRLISILIAIFHFSCTRYVICNREGLVLRRMPTMPQNTAEKYARVRYFNMCDNSRSLCFSNRLIHFAVLSYST